MHKAYYTSVACLMCCMAGNLLGSEPEDQSQSRPVTADEIRTAVERSLAIIEKASAGSADQRMCFTCHSQAMPVFALVEASGRGFKVDAENLKRQVQHTYDHLRRGRKSYEEGKGQGGKVDTAGYALWTLEDGEHPSDDVTQLVADYILDQQNDRGYWKNTSNRPPSEASRFTTTYIAIRALSNFHENGTQVSEALDRAAKWLESVEPSDTEDRVFQLLSTNYVSISPERLEQLRQELIAQQLESGGWSQLKDSDADAYATGTALYALARTGMKPEDEVWQRGIRYLLDTQHDEGSWHVVTRSDPFQEYYETGFPHGDDQFISTSASCWATLSLLFSLPE